jgi:hypothetical protein
VLRREKQGHPLFRAFVKARGRRRVCA